MVEYEDANQEVQQEEPVGAQVLRRLHSDGSTLLQEYDEMMGLLDHPDVKNHLHSHLRGLDKFLSGTEKLFGKHYKELSPLEDGVDEEDGEGNEEFEDEDESDEEFPLEEENGEPQEGEEQDPYQEDMPPDQVVAQEQEDLAPDDAVEADGDRPDPPSPEEALEGMQRADAEQYEPGEMGVKGNDKTSRHQVGDQGHQSSKPGYHRDDYGIYGNTPTEDARNNMRDEEGPSRDLPTRVDESARPLQTQEEDTHKPGYHRDDLGTYGNIPMEEARNSDRRWEGNPSPDQKSIFQDHEMGKLTEAHGFLQELSQSRDFGDLHRMKAYHFHKSLEPLGMVDSKEANLDSSPSFEMANGEPEPTTGEKGAGPNQPRPARIRFYPGELTPGSDPNNRASYPDSAEVSEDRDVMPIGGTGLIRARAQGRQVDRHKIPGVVEGTPGYGGTPGFAPINRRATQRNGVRTRPIKVEGVQPPATQSTKPEQKTYKVGNDRTPQVHNDPAVDLTGVQAIDWDTGEVQGHFNEAGEYVDHTSGQSPNAEDKGLTSHPHRQSVAEVSNFFRDLCLEKAFGEPHREKALYYHKLLAPILGDKDCGMGEMDTKGQGPNWRDEQDPTPKPPSDSPRVQGISRDPNVREGNDVGGDMHIARQRYQNRARNDAREDRRHQVATQWSLDAEGNSTPSGHIRVAPRDDSDNSHPQEEGPPHEIRVKAAHNRKSLDEVAVDQAVTIAELTKTLQSITEQLG